MYHFPRQIHRAVTRHPTGELYGLQEAFFLRSSVLRRHAVNMKRDNRGKTGDYRIRSRSYRKPNDINEPKPRSLRAKTKLRNGVRSNYLGAHLLSIICNASLTLTMSSEANRVFIFTSLPGDLRD